MPHPKKFARPGVETLSARIVPAVTFRLTGGTLFLQGDNAPNDIEITRTATVVTVSVNGGPALPFRPSALVVRTGGGDDFVALDWTAATPLTGGVLIQTGNGDDIVSLNSLTATADGTIRGNLNVQTGRGDDLVGIAIEGGLTVGGSATFDGGLGEDGLLAVDSEDHDWLIGGGLAIYHFDEIELDASTTVGSQIVVGRDLTIITPSTPIFVGIYFDDVVIGRNLTILTGATGEDVELEDFTVGGNVFVNLGEGDNEFDIDDNPAGVAIQGNLFFVAGAGDDLVDLEENLTIGGNLNINLGGGDNAYFNFDENFLVGGDVIVRAGNGDNIFLESCGFTANGNVSILFGNGTNAIAFDGATLGGTLRIRLGNGDNFVLIDAGGALYALDLFFGTGTNDLELDDGTFTGLIVAAGATTLTQDPSAIFLPTLVIDL